jgi:hypothetical protein
MPDRHIRIRRLQRCVTGNRNHVSRFKLWLIKARESFPSVVRLELRGSIVTVKISNYCNFLAHLLVNISKDLKSIIKLGKELYLQDSSVQN